MRSRISPATRTNPTGTSKVMNCLNAATVGLLEDNGPSILNDVGRWNRPILVSDEEKKRARHDEP